MLASDPVRVLPPARGFKPAGRSEIRKSPRFGGDDGIELVIAPHGFTTMRSRRQTARSRCSSSASSSPSRSSPHTASRRRDRAAPRDGDRPRLGELAVGASYHHLWELAIAARYRAARAPLDASPPDQRRPHGRVLLPRRARDQARGAGRRAGAHAAGGAARRPRRSAGWSCRPCIYARRSTRRPGAAAGESRWRRTSPSRSACWRCSGPRPGGAQGLPAGARDRRRHRRGAGDRAVLHAPDSLGRARGRGGRRCCWSRPRTPSGFAPPGPTR